ncbi:hypothetical protein F4859DRAFT_462104 [Xylaria cf. heliscus]|nr:hypothetical protein F4859DRAFT_462104 [Xylaria cf. heliscus]
MNPQIPALVAIIAICPLLIAKLETRPHGCIVDYCCCYFILGVDDDELASPRSRKVCTRSHVRCGYRDPWLKLRRRSMFQPHQGSIVKGW